MKNLALIHYHEIALKGNNRPWYEKKLVESLNSHLPDSEIERLSGRILVRSNEDREKIKEKLKKTFGVANYSLVKKTDLDLEEMKVALRGLAEDLDFDSFRIDTKRQNKDFRLDSMEISRKLGSFIVEEFEKDVDLEEPDITFYVEVLYESALLYNKKHEGPGGLPVGTSGSFASLLSNGFDSPLAAWKIARRGGKCHFVHFHSYPHTTKKAQKLVEDIAGLLSEWQKGGTLSLVPFGDIQREITSVVDPELRLLVYRREMFRLASFIADENNYDGLVTGESLGQVASQTPENMRAVSSVTDYPVYRPLIGDNKQDIIDLSRSIGLFEYSSQDAEDCCNLFVPDHPETKASIEQLNKEEEGLDLKDLREEALENIEIKNY